MSKPNTNKTKDFDALLNELKSPSDNLDAFEQEALDGFAMLNNEDEVRKLKEKLDVRIENEVVRKKRKPLFIYWSAAAGIALVFVLIVLLKNNNTLEKNDLAQALNPQEEQSLEGVIQNPNEFESDEQKTNQPDDKLKDNVSGKSKSPSKSAESLSESDDSEETPGQNGPLSKAAPVSPNEEAKDLSDKNASGMAYGASQSSARDEDAADSKADESPKPRSITKKEKSKEEESFAEKSGQLEKEKSKKSQNRLNAAQSEAPAVKSEITGAFEDSNVGVAKLTISKEELHALIEKFFRGKSYKKSFNCNITINASSEVDNVEFENPAIFKKSEIKEITAFLKKQKCFKNKEYALYSGYKLKYVAE